ncbi:MAG TPA: PIN domain-containing protein [Longimicrobium sp.]
MRRRSPQIRPRVLLVDTNVLLVLLLGASDPAHIQRFKRTHAYSAADFELLTDFISGFSELVVTPNVLTEASNLAGQLAEPLRSEVFTSLAVLATQTAERYFPSRDAVREVDFVRLGLADISVLLAARERVMVLTDDLQLYLRLAALNLHVVNYHHLREGAVEG